MGQETKREDLVAKNAFSSIQSEAESLLVVIDNLEKGFNSLLETSTKLSKETPLKGAENIKQVTKALNESEETVEGLIKLNDLRVKQVKELEKVEKARLGGLAELQKQLNELKKQQKEVNTQAKKNLLTDDELAKQQSELTIQIKATK